MTKKGNPMDIWFQEYNLNRHSDIPPFFQLDSKLHYTENLKECREFGLNTYLESEFYG